LPKHLLCEKQPFPTQEPEESEMNSRNAAADFFENNVSIRLPTGRLVDLFFALSPAGRGKALLVLVVKVDRISLTGLADVRVTIILPNRSSSGDLHGESG